MNTNNNNSTTTQRRSIFATLKRWLGNKAEDANNAMDSSLSVEEQLDRTIKNLKRQYEEIRSSNTLASVRGAYQQTEDKLKETRKKYAKGNYEVAIKHLMQQNNETAALNLLEEKDALEQEIEELKEQKNEYQIATQQIEEDLNRLEKEIKDQTKLLDKLRVENQKAEQTQEMYSLMNEVTNLTSSVDTSDVQRRIDENKRRSYGTKAEYDRTNTTSRINEDVRKAALKSKLDQYK